MFAVAYKVVSSFTHPVVISNRFFDNTVECGCGAFVVINDEGWIITVAHLWDSFFLFQQHAKEISDYQNQLKLIQQDKNLDGKRKKKKIDHLKKNPRWITNHSFWWARDNVQLKDVKPLPEGDIIIGRLDPFDSKSIGSYPVLKDPANLSIGTSLCKLGYPFHKIEATFDETKNMFELAPGALPMPRFPIEGIYTRNVVVGKSKDGRYDIKFLETSSPGLRGQSGGPVFDVKGTIWAVQSRTAHFPLGFSPKVKKNGERLKKISF